MCDNCIYHSKYIFLGTTQHENHFYHLYMDSFRKLQTFEYDVPTIWNEKDKCLEPYQPKHFHPNDNSWYTEDFQMGCNNTPIDNYGFIVK